MKNYNKIILKGLLKSCCFGCLVYFVCVTGIYAYKANNYNKKTYLNVVVKDDEIFLTAGK